MENISEFKQVVMNWCGIQGGGNGLVEGLSSIYPLLSGALVSVWYTVCLKKKKKKKDLYFFEMLYLSLQFAKETPKFCLTCSIICFTTK